MLGPKPKYIWDNVDSNNSPRTKLNNNNSRVNTEGGHRRNYSHNFLQNESSNVHLNTSRLMYNNNENNLEKNLEVTRNELRFNTKVKLNTNKDINKINKNNNNSNNTDNNEDDNEDGFNTKREKFYESPIKNNNDDYSDNDNYKSKREKFYNSPIKGIGTQNKNPFLDNLKLKTNDNKYNLNFQRNKLNTVIHTFKRTEDKSRSRSREKLNTISNTITINNNNNNNNNKNDTNNDTNNENEDKQKYYNFPSNRVKTFFSNNTDENDEVTDIFRKLEKEKRNIRNTYSNYNTRAQTPNNLDILKNVVRSTRNIKEDMHNIIKVNLDSSRGNKDDTYNKLKTDNNLINLNNMNNLNTTRSRYNPDNTDRIVYKDIKDDNKLNINLNLNSYRNKINTQNENRENNTEKFNNLVQAQKHQRVNSNYDFMYNNTYTTPYNDTVHKDKYIENMNVENLTRVNKVSKNLGLDCNHTNVNNVNIINNAVNFEHVDPYIDMKFQNYPANVLHKVKYYDGNADINQKFKMDYLWKKYN